MYQQLNKHTRRRTIVSSAPYYVRSNYGKRISHRDFGGLFYLHMIYTISQKQVNQFVSGIVCICCQSIQSLQGVFLNTKRYDFITIVPTAFDFQS